jgi:hypothetical protein
MTSNNDQQQWNCKAIDILSQHSVAQKLQKGAATMELWNYPPNSQCKKNYKKDCLKYQQQNQLLSGVCVFIYTTNMNTHTQY